MPERIQMRRSKGWRLPEGAVVVARPTGWGNPFRHADRAVAARMFRAWLLGTCRTPTLLDCASLGRLPERRQAILQNLHTLRGRILACWCAPGGACHADVLLELANAPLLCQPAEPR
jgi:hypothetical protein